MKSIGEAPLVTIWCMTYNHEKFIKDALESFLAQETSFPYEIVVHDDASTDGTRDILREYEKKYPNIIRVVYQRENIFRKENMWQLLKNVQKREFKGKYVAFCEGDDYWTDVHKLQIQVDYMEENVDCILSVHNAKLINYMSGESYLMNPALQTGKLSEEQIIMQYRGIFPSASRVVRKEMAILDDFFLGFGIGDWPLQLQAITKGYIYYFHKEMSVYRYKHEGSWTKETIYSNKKHFFLCMQMIDLLEKYNGYTDKKLEKWIVSKISVYIFLIVDIFQSCEEEDFVMLCEKINVETGGKYKILIDKIYSLVKQICKLDYCSQKMINFCKEHEKVIVWGIGKLGAVCSEQLNRNGLIIDGYMVSHKNNDMMEFKNKPVYQLDEISFMDDKTGIIVAIDPRKWHELKLSLDEYDISDYYAPFLFEL